MEGRRTLDDLRAMTDLKISNHLAAEVIGMDPQRLAEYARAHEIGWECVVSGNRVLHNREDFIRYWSGEKEVQTDNDMKIAITEALATILETQKLLLSLLDKQNDLLNKMTAS